MNVNLCDGCGNRAAWHYEVTPFVDPVEGDRWDLCHECNRKVLGLIDNRRLLTQA